MGTYKLLQVSGAGCRKPSATSGWRRQVPSIGSSGFGIRPYTFARFGWIRYITNADRWSFASYTYAYEKYKPSFPLTGEDHGTAEQALKTSALFY